MRRGVLSPLLCVLASVHAGEEPTPAEIFRRAVAAQGGLPADRIADVAVEFKGNIREKDAGRHAIVRRYWYRSADRSFRLRTESRADRDEWSERGVFGDNGFWELGDGGAVFRLSEANRDDRPSVAKIEKERDDFEDILRLVLLARMEEGGGKISAAEPGTVRIERDLPHEADAILGEARGEHAYHVLDVDREDLPRLRLFVRTDDATVRKAIAFRRDDAAAPEWFYYFGRFLRDERTGLQLPVVLSVHEREPLDPESLRAGERAWGTIQVRVNASLSDGLFRGEPASAK
ncbi:MAG: hypothetical protein ACREID_01640 [Planctomycetota bacterium]